MPASEIAFGLGGILLGALLTGAVEVFSDWNQRRLVKRAAARTVFGDLHLMVDRLRVVLEDENWSELPSSSSDDWILYRDALSNGMPGPAFHIVAAAYNELRILGHVREVERPFNEVRCRAALDRFTEAEEVIESESLTRRDRRWFQKQGRLMTSRTAG
jgi:hypothetical protein